MSNEDDMKMVMVGNETVSLAALAGVDMSNIDEKRFTVTPEGVFVFRVRSGEKAPHLVTKGEDKAAVEFVLEILQIVSVKDKSQFPDGDPSKYIGKDHIENQFITNADSLGYIKAFCVDLGAPKQGMNLATMAASRAGVVFQAPVTHRANPNDKAQVFASIDRSKIKLGVQV